jgi:hypothetical protein
VVQGVGPEFKPQYCKKKKRIRKRMIIFQVDTKMEPSGLIRPTNLEHLTNNSYEK